MSKHEQDNRDHQYERPIKQVKYEAFQARRKVRRELPSVSPQTKLELAEILDDYRDQLSDYRHDTALETAWDERKLDVDVIEELLNQTVDLQTGTDWLGRPQYQTMPKVAEVDARYLIRIGKELDSIAMELGFAANSKEQMVKAQDVPNKLPDHIKEQAPAFQNDAEDSGESE